eukprot:333207-Amphidinium_carterae.1
MVCCPREASQCRQLDELVTMSDPRLLSDVLQVGVGHSAGACRNGRPTSTSNCMAKSPATRGSLSASCRIRTCSKQWRSGFSLAAGSCWKTSGRPCAAQFSRESTDLCEPDTIGGHTAAGIGPSLGTGAAAAEGPRWCDLHVRDSKTQSQHRLTCEPRPVLRVRRACDMDAAASLSWTCADTLLENESCENS